MDEFQNLMVGSSGRGVVKLQGWLNVLLKLKPPLQITGVFDQKTEAALRKFQEANKIPVNYHPVVGFNTWRAMGKKLGQNGIFSDPDLPAPLKSIMAPDVIGSPGNLNIDKIGFSLLSMSRFEKENLNTTNLHTLLDFMAADGAVSDLRWFAYMLATVLIECGAKLAPIAEGGCNDSTGCSAITQTINGVMRTNNRDYGKPRACPNTQSKPPQPCPAGKTTHTYYGRGYVQLTHFGNYQTMAQRLGQDLIHFPERAMQPATAYSIMSLGMREGLFTGKRLDQFIAGTKADYRNARDIINPGDTATYEAGERHAKRFEEILEASVRR